MIDPSHPADGVPASKARLRENFRAIAEAIDELRARPPGGGLTGWADAVRGFGAAGDGKRDDTASLQAALNSGADVVWIPAGTYRITKGLTIVPGTTLFGAGPGKTIIDATGLPDQFDPAALRCTGTPVALPVLAGVIIEGDRRVIFNSVITSLLAVGDYVGIVDKRDFSFMSDSASDRDGCWVTVLARSGNTIVTSSGIPRTLPSPRIPGGGVTSLDAFRMDRRGVELRGFSLDCRGLGSWPDGTTQRGKGIVLRYLADPVIENVHVRGAPTTGIDIDRCPGAKINHVRSHSIGPGWTDAMAMYGAAISGCAFVAITNSHFIGGRHALDFDKGSGDQPFRNILSHDNNIDNCVLEAPPDNSFMAPGSTVTWALTWHESTIRCNVRNSTILGGVSWRGFGHQIQNNVILMHRHAGNKRPLAGDHIGPRGGVTVTGNFIRSYTTEPFCRIDFDRMEAGEDPSVVDISGNTFDDRSSTTAPVIEFLSGPPAGKVAVKIHDNVVLSGNTRPFLNIASSAGNFVRGSIFDNQLPANVALGKVANVSEWVARNMIGGHLTFANLPTWSPGGTGRLWNDGGTLRVT